MKLGLLGENPVFDCCWWILQGAETLNNWCLWCGPVAFVNIYKERLLWWSKVLPHSANNGSFTSHEIKFTTSTSHNMKEKIFIYTPTSLLPLLGKQHILYIARTCTVAAVSQLSITVVATCLLSRRHRDCELIPCEEDRICGTSDVCAEHFWTFELFSTVPPHFVSRQLVWSTLDWIMEARFR